MSDVTLGQIIDGLGVDSRLEEGDLVSSAIVLLLVIEEDGSERLSVRWSEGLSWLTRAGMLHHALDEESADTYRTEPKDDD